jgi:asparagine synthase (glutamine-hydrolysing)
LTKRGHQFRSRTDTEVLLKSFEEWGPDCLSRLNGMFAFAVWDEHRRELFAARDRFGEKPFYFVHDTQRNFFAFASEIKALLASGLFSPRPNPSAVYGYLVNREIDTGTETIFDGVQALPAAHSLTYSFRTGAIRIARYWDLDPQQEIRLSGPNEYAERFLELFSDSVRIRLRSDVPVGSSLSGGLDSSTIVGLVAKSGPSAGQETFSARFEDPHLDEGKYIDRVTNWAKVRSNSIYPEAARIPDEMEALTRHQDAPFYSTSVYAQWCVMRLASERGVTVLLDGQGGDEVLAGYHSYFGPYYTHLLKGLRWKRAFSEMRDYAAEHGRGFVPRVLAGMLPEQWGFAAKSWLVPRGLRPEFKSKWRRPPASVKRKYKNELQQSLYTTLTQSVLPQLLRYADRNSMAFSREVRLPFLDHRLVEFLYATPYDQKLRGTQTKIILRNAITGIVPEEIRLRKDKLGFAPPEVAWLRGPLRSWVGEVFASTAFCQNDWCEPATVNAVWERFLLGEDRLHTSIWRWLSLEMWARVCLRTPSTKPVGAESVCNYHVNIATSL